MFMANSDQASSSCEARRSNLVLVAFQLTDQRVEVAGLAEVLVDRGEADVSDLVQAGQRLHHQLADHIRRYLILAHGFQAAHDAGNGAVYPFAFHGTLAQGVVDRALQLIAVEGLAAAILLEHDQFAQLDAFKGGEASAAFGAMAAAGGGRIVLRRTAVLHLAVVMSAEWATHGFLLLWIDRE